MLSSDPPGAPNEVTFVFSDLTSITVQCTLSEEGSTPFTHLEVALSSDAHDIYMTNITTPPLGPSYTVKVIIPDLQEDTEYVLTMAIYNRGGKGAASKNITVSTSK